MSEENHNVEKLTGALGVNANELNAGAHTFLQDLTKEQLSHLTDALKNVPAQTTKQLLNADMRGYVLQAIEKEFISVEQAPALVMMLENRNFKHEWTRSWGNSELDMFDFFGSEDNEEFQHTPPEIGEIIPDSWGSSVGDFHELIREELLQIAKTQHSDNLPDTLPGVFANVPLEALVQDGKIVKSAEEAFSNIVNGLGLDEKTEQGFSSLPEEERQQAMDVRTSLMQEMVERSLSAKTLSDDKNRTSPKMKEALKKVWEMEPETFKEVHHVFQEAKKQEGTDAFLVLQEELKKKGLDTENVLQQPPAAEQKEKASFFSGKKGLVTAAALGGVVALVLMKMLGGNKEQAPPANSR